MKVILIAALLLMAIGAGWRHRAVIHDGLEPTASRPKPLVFDNGTVRDVPAPAARPTAALTRADGLRKCVRGSQTTYTNFDCPAGFKQKNVTTDRVTVLEAQAGRAAPASKPKAAGAQRRLQDALDLSADDKLRERMMERAVDAGSR